MIPQRPRQLTQRLICGDCLEVLETLPDDSVDLVFGSPPYEDARTYGIDFNLKGQEWVGWMVEVFRQSQRVCKGLVAFVVQGRTRNYKWSCTPALLIADLHRAGFNVREPLYYHRSGIPGSGGPDDMRHDLEYVVRTSKPGRLVWSDNTACGELPKWQPGGPPSHRTKNGKRCNLVHTKTMPNGEKKLQGYTVPKIANPGNVICCIVGGGQLGSNLAHENEAPFPEKLAKFFIKSFCPPGGVVLDPFCGSSTTGAVCVQQGRGYVGVDCRANQIELSTRRLDEERLQLSNRQ